MADFEERVVAKERRPHFIADFDRLKDLLRCDIGVVQSEDTASIDDFMQDNGQTVDIAFLSTLDRCMRIANDFRGGPK